jgi:hypothetical protein
MLACALIGCVVTWLERRARRGDLPAMPEPAGGLDLLAWLSKD